jgi:hypothetical protein
MKGEGIAMHTADSVELSGAASLTKLETRRTGVLFLSLIVATNFVPWMQLAQVGIDSALPPSPAESSLVIASCLIAAALVTVTWLVGRRSPAIAGRRTVDARDAGLLLALLAAGANLALAALVHRRASTNTFSAELRWFGIFWYGIILPTEMAAGFFKGRASIPTPRPLPQSAGS